MTREAAAVPEGLAEKYEKTVDILSTKLKQKRDDMMKAVGERPYKGIPVSAAERLSRYSQIRRDTVALKNIFTKNAKVKPGGRVLIPKGLIKQMQEMEKTIRIGRE